jgi:hypothetical protein
VQNSKPVWFVSGGSGSVLGPFALSDLELGVASGRLSPDAWVWRHPWEEARPILSVRELGAQYHRFLRAQNSWDDEDDRDADAIAEDEWRAWLADATDSRELVAMALQGLVLATQASLGVAHLPRGSEFVASAVVGEGSDDLLGASTSRRDLALGRAQLGAVVIPRATHSRIGEASLSRLGDLGADSFALTPLFAGPRLLAILELGRADHPFRTDDDRYLRGTAQTVRERAGALALASLS